MPTVYKTLGQVIVGSTRAFGAISNKVIASNVVTITTTANHNLAVGDIVLVAGVDTTCDGTVAVASAPTTTTFTYRSATATLASAAVSPNATFVRTHNLGGVVSANIYSTGVYAVVSTSSAHGLSPNDWAFVTCGNAATDGLVKVIAAPTSTSLTYAKTGTAVASTAVTSGAVARAISSTWTTLYTVPTTTPTSTTAVVSTVAVTNQTTSTANYRIAITSEASTPLLADMLVFDGVVSAGDTITMTLGLTLPGGKKIMVQANQPEISFSAFGIENAPAA